MFGNKKLVELEKELSALREELAESERRRKSERVRLLTENESLTRIVNSTLYAAEEWSRQLFHFINSQRSKNDDYRIFYQSTDRIIFTKNVKIFKNLALDMPAELVSIFWVGPHSNDVRLKSARAGNRVIESLAGEGLTLDLLNKRCSYATRINISEMLSLELECVGDFQPDIVVYASFKPL